MNERINQLALQARLGPALLLHYWGTVDALADSEQDGLEQIEKFAALIVQECAGVVENAVNHREPASTYVGKIKQHFGVEE
jgi:hypothetical protein